ncbi:MAG: hypothetical protein S4CHLAM102_04930 [Chlamydiia bacterium]|nr:hypothetical protein [Chlamydiia bacterium]
MKPILLICTLLTIHLRGHSHELFNDKPRLKPRQAELSIHHASHSWISEEAYTSWLENDQLTPIRTDSRTPIIEKDLLGEENNVPCFWKHYVYVAADGTEEHVMKYGMLVHTTQYDLTFTFSEENEYTINFIEKSIETFKTTLIE